MFPSQAIIRIPTGPVQSAERAPDFAVDLSDLALEDALMGAGADATADIRSPFAGLPAREASTLAYARGLLYWNRQQRYCRRCGGSRPGFPIREYGSQLSGLSRKKFASFILLA
jgi:hypothetical protein